MNKTNKLALAGIGALTLTTVNSDEVKAQVLNVDTSPRRLPTLSINTSDGVSCNSGNGAQPSFNLGSTYDRNGQLKLGAVLVIPLGDNRNRCDKLMALEEKRSKLRYLGELLDFGLISEDEFVKEAQKYNLLNVS